MKIFLLVLGIVCIVATVLSTGLSALFLYAYMFTMDAPFETYQMQKTAFIVFGVLAIVLLIGSILIFRARKKLNDKF